MDLILLNPRHFRQTDDSHAFGYVCAIATPWKFDSVRSDPEGLKARDVNDKHV